MARVKIKGAIVSNDDKWVYEWFGLEATSPKDITDVIEKLDGEDLEIEINSPGGNVFAGSEIYTALKNYPGKVTVNIVGLAASAASVAAMSGDVVRISPTAQIMIHNAWSYQEGDYKAMQHSAEVLENVNKSIANAYILKTGLSQEKLLELMDRETWLNAKQAKELGFVDEIMFDENNQIAAASKGYLLPPEVINKIRNLVKNPANEDKKLYEARLRFLKMKGECISEDTRILEQKK